MSDSVRPHRRQPTRLCRPWDSPGKNTGVGCHFLFQCMKVKNESESAQSCPILCDPIDSSPPGSPVPGILQARTLEWVAISFSRVTGKFGLGIQNEAGQRLIEFCQENALVIANTLFEQHKRRLHMDITRWSTQKSDYILCCQDGEALYSQQKQDQELTVAQVMNSLLPNSHLN